MKKIPTLFERVYDHHKIVNILPNVTEGMEWVLNGGVNMIKYVVKYCLRSDCRETLRLDAYYDTFTDAINKALELETDPDIYTAWTDQEEVTE